MKHVFLRQNFAPDDGRDPVSRGKKLCSEFAKSALDFRQPRNCRFIFEEDRELKLQFGGCYDGILCFYEFRRLSDDGERVKDLVIYICNPALNESKVISRPRELLHSKRRMTRVCFVSDPASGNYKIIVVSGCESTPRVYVFRLNGSCWSEIDTSRRLSNRHSRISDLVVHNGCVYWMILFHDYNKLNVLDLHQESVGEIMLPDYLRYKTIDSRSLSLLRHQGSLAICSNYSDHQQVELYVMKEENDGISWGGKVEINLRAPCVQLRWRIGISSCFHMLICKMPMAATSSLGCLVSCKKENTYLLSSGESEESLGKFCIPFRTYGCICADYVPSLVSVRR